MFRDMGLGLRVWEREGAGFRGGIGIPRKAQSSLIERAISLKRV